MNIGRDLHILRVAPEPYPLGHPGVAPVEPQLEPVPASPPEREAVPV